MGKRITEMVLLFIAIVAVGIGIAGAQDVVDFSPFWPQPSRFYFSQNEEKPLILAANFQFTAKASFDSDILSKAMVRYAELLKPNIQSGEISSCIIAINGTETQSSKSSFINGVDESYSFSVNYDTCNIKASTIWGAINAMETFTQIFVRNSDGSVTSQYIDVDVSDWNRFTHRGIMIDTSRHYLPVDTITRMIDAAKMSKFNVLHIHLVDAQSFPFNSISYPNLVKGAYSQRFQYTTDDIEHITDYAYDRGIRILYEIDVPGHAASWGKGYPEVLADCLDKYDNINNIALNPTMKETYEILHGILKDISDYSSHSPYIHIGGLLCFPFPFFLSFVFRQ